MSNNTSLVEILSKCINNGQSLASSDGRSVRFNFSENDKTEIETTCASIGITPEFHLNNQCEIRIDGAYDNGTLVLFFDEIDFLKRSTSHFINFEQSHFVILKNETTSLQKLPQEKFSKEKSLFFNFFYYQHLLRFLEKQEHFISVNSRPDLQFVIFSSEKGPFHIGYNLHEERVKNLEDLSLVYQSLESEFQKIDFVQFFKSAVINTIYEYSIPERFFYLVQSLRVILSVAHRDHYIYIRNFDFEKIKTKFQEGRNKYFESLEKNIESISKQVTSFPLTFAASVFAGYQVKDRPVILILVFMAYALYTLIAWDILSITSFNTDSIKTDVTKEENKIKTSYDLLYSDFKDDFDGINTKISKIENLIQILRAVLIGLLICFFIFGGYQIFFASKEKPIPTEVRVIK